MEQYELHIRPEAPIEEVINALETFKNCPQLYTVNSEGKINLWSSTAWNVGYALPKN